MSEGSHAEVTRILSLSSNGDDELHSALDSTVGIDVLTATGIDDARELLSTGGVDCVVVHDSPDRDWSDAVSTLREAASIPILAVTTPDRAGDLLAAGVTDVLRRVDGDLDPDVAVARIESLVGHGLDRPADLGGDRGRDRTLADSNDALQRLHEVTANADLDFERQVERTLEVGADYLGLDVAFAARVDQSTDAFEVFAARGGHPILRAGADDDLTETYCRRTVEATDETPLAISNADEELAGDPAHRKYRLGCYLGECILVDGSPYGTLCFASEDPRANGFTAEERSFVAILARWLGRELERREYSRELQSSRDRFEQTVERIDDAFFALDDEWHVTYANERGAEVLREAMGLPYEAAKLQGTHLWEAAPEAVGTTFYERYHEALETQTPVTFEEYYDPLDGWFEVRAYPDADGLSVFFTEITDRKEHERRLQRFQTLTESISDVIVSIDGESVVRHVNPAVEEVLGYDPDALVGEPLTRIMPDRFVEAHHQAVAQYLRTGDRQLDWDYVELPAEHADGHEVPLAISFSEFTVGDEHFFTGVLRDITDRKERERTLNDLIDATQRFHRASSRPELLESLLDAAEEVFGYDLTSVRIHDPETGTSSLTRTSSAGVDPFPDDEIYDDESGMLGEAVQSGESLVVDDLASASDGDHGPVESAMFVPLGERGTFAVGARDPDAFDAEDAALVELLAVAATDALDRLDRESEMRNLQRIVDQVDEMVFLLDEEGAFSFVTDRLAAFLGVDRDALVGTPLVEVVDEEYAETCRGRLAVLGGPFSDRNAVFEAEVTGPGGERRPVELELSAIAGEDDAAAVAGSLVDISELAATRRDLAAERNRFEELFESLPDPVVEAKFEDGDPIVQYVNPAFTDVFGYDADRVEGRNLNEFIVPEHDRERARRLDDRATSGTRTSAPVRRETASGPRDFLLRGISYTRNDDTYGFAVYTDITEQKQRERYLQVLNRVLRHNLRNDLNVAVLIAERLASDVEDQDLRAEAELLRETVEGVTSLSEKAREIERVLEKRTEEPTPRDVAADVRRALASFREDYPEADVGTDLPAELWVRGVDEIPMALGELLENSIEHGSTSPRIHVAARPDDDRDGWVTVSVSDDGDGIPDHEWQIVTGEEDITQLNHGSGLGLWLTRWIVDACGGEIRREDDDEWGTTVTLAFRAATPRSADRSAIAESE